MRTPEQEASHLIQTHGTNALSTAEREYSTAMEMEDLKTQGYWLDVVTRIKTGLSQPTTRDV